MIFFLGLMMLVMSLQEFKKERKAYGWLFVVVFSFHYWYQCKVFYWAKGCFNYVITLYARNSNIEVIFLQKCNKCNAPFSWSELYKIIVRSSKPFKCNNCETEHSITVSGRFTFVFLTLVPAMIFMNFLSPFDNYILTLVIGIFILSVGSLLAPYFVKYKGRLWRFVLKLKGQFSGRRIISERKRCQIRR